LPKLPHSTADKSDEAFEWQTSSREDDTIEAFGGKYAIPALGKVA
jgi:hypothetical protein